MGRTVVIEERVHGDLKKLTASGQIQLGLLVGQVSSSKDYVSLFVRTPALHEVSEGGSYVLSDFSQVEDWWVKEHARQVCALLCGGLAIVGVAVCCSTEQFKVHRLRCRQWLSDITLGHYCGSSIMLHCPTNSKKYVCQTIDVSDNQGGFRPAELKFQSHLEHWLQLEATLSINWTTYLPSRDKGQVSSTSDILQPLLEQLSSAMVMVQGHPELQGRDLLIRMKRSSSQRETVKMEWLTQLCASESSLPELWHQEARKMSLCGCLALVAYVPPKATLDDAVAAMKQDAERSLLARIATLTEDTGTQTPTLCGMHQLPARVFVSLPHFPFELSEYMLPSESLEECTNRVCELTGCLATELTTQVCEHFSPPPVVTRETVAIEAVDSSVVKSYSGLVSIVAAVGVALLAIAFWLVTFLQSA